MKEATKETLLPALAAWEYLKSLPNQLHGFRLTRDRREDGDIYDIFSYRNEAAKRKITVYYHEETKEYKARVTVGMTEFCNIDFIAANLPSFEKLLTERFDRALRDLGEFNPGTIDSIVADKKILEWNYADRLPETIEGFSLFIRPSQPLRIINGSYIVFDYSDFASESNFIIYYNIFRDEFFGEAKIRRLPEMNYMFDTNELADLEEKLDLYLMERLRELRKRINHEENGG